MNFRSVALDKRNAGLETQSASTLYLSTGACFRLQLDPAHFLQISTLPAVRLFSPEKKGWKVVEPDISVAAMASFVIETNSFK